MTARSDRDVDVIPPRNVRARLGGATTPSDVLAQRPVPDILDSSLRISHRLCHSDVLSHRRGRLAAQTPVRARLQLTVDIDCIAVDWPRQDVEQPQYGVRDLLVRDGMPDAPIHDVSAKHRTDRSLQPLEADGLVFSDRRSMGDTRQLTVDASE